MHVIFGGFSVRSTLPLVHFLTEEFQSIPLYNASLESDETCSTTWYYYRTSLTQTSVTRMNQITEHQKNQQPDMQIHGILIHPSISVVHLIKKKCNGLRYRSISLSEHFLSQHFQLKINCIRIMFNNKRKNTLSVNFLFNCYNNGTSALAIFSPSFPLKC